VQAEVRAASEYILKTPVNLFVQALATFEVLHHVITNAPNFFAQRKPYELGSFRWTVDGKDKAKVTRWEEWWANYARGALSTMSKRRPAGRFGENLQADYSFFEKFRSNDGTGEDGISMTVLLKDIQFLSGVQYGLEMVDILANAVRRSLAGNLQKEGWRNIHRLMIHRNEEPYISFVAYREGPDIIRNPPYAGVVREGFSKGGRPMLTKRNMALAMAAPKEPHPGALGAS
jgi:hypothetical protein